MVDFERARQVMVDTQLRPGSITDRRILAIMGAVPRENFVPPARRELAYIDDVQPLGPAGAARRYLPSPAPFARLVQLAAIQPGDRVLDVGCATGYSVAVLAGLAAAVVGIDNDPGLLAAAKANLTALGADNAELLEADLAAGAPTRAPFDAIVIEGAVESVPQPLLAQLGEGGRLVALIRTGVTAVAHLYVRNGGDVTGRAEFNASLPPLEMVKRHEEFVF